MRPLLSFFITLNALFALVCSSSDADAANARQVIVVRATPETKAQLVHEPGDTIALLVVEHPPPKIAQILGSQLGEWCTKVERRNITNDTHTFALALRDETTVPEIAWGKRPRALRIRFTPKKKSTRPDPADVIGHVPGLQASTVGGLPLPPLPERHPCQVPVDAKSCAHFRRAIEAAQFLDEGRSVDTFERWAFQFHGGPQWTNHLPAYAYVALIVSRVLVQRDLVPEAELVLTKRDALRIPAIAPYAALTLAAVYDRSSRPKEAETLLSTLIDKVVDPKLRSRATLELLSTYIHIERFDDAAALAARLTETNSETGDVAAEALLLSAEVRMAVQDLEGARELFRRAAKSVADPNLAATIHLRLGDLVLRTNGKNAVIRRHYERAERGAPCTQERLALRRLLRHGPTAPRVTLASHVEAIAREGGCVAVRVEATYADAFLRSLAGDDDAAIGLLERARAANLRDRGETWAVDAAYLSAIRTLTEIWVGRLVRSEDWPGVVELFETRLAPMRAVLNAETLVALSRAHRALGIDVGLFTELLVALRSGLPKKIERDVLLELSESFLVAEDEFRADVSTAYYLEKHEDDPDVWKGRHLAARVALRQQQPDLALAHLDAAAARTPRGDALQESRYLRVRALTAKKDPTAAASTLLEWLDGTPTPSDVAGALAVGVTSDCLRDCSVEIVAQLLKRIESFEGGALLSERMQVLAKQRGIELKGSEAQEGEREGVWKRLDDALATSNEAE